MDKEYRLARLAEMKLVKGKATTFPYGKEKYLEVNVKITTTAIPFPQYYQDDPNEDSNNYLTESGEAKLQIDNEQTNIDVEFNFPDEKIDGETKTFWKNRTITIKNFIKNNLTIDCYERNIRISYTDSFGNIPSVLIDEEPGDWDEIFVEGSFHSYFISLMLKQQSKTKTKK